MPRVIELVEGEHGWSVTDTLRGEFATYLASDEALWVVAQMLTGIPSIRYAKTYEQHVAWERRYHGWSEVPVAALADLRASAPVVMARKMGRVVRTFDDQGEVINRFIRLKGSAE